MVKERPYEMWTRSRLDKHYKLIESEIKIRDFENGGQDGENFRNLHSLPECSINTNYIRTVTVGRAIGLSPVDDFDIHVFYFRYQCAAHDVSSKEFGSSKWINENESALEIEYPAYRDFIVELRESKDFSGNYTNDYLIKLEERAIRAGIISEEERISQISS